MPVVTQMRELVHAGAIGEMQSVWCRHFVGHGGDYYFKDWHADRSRSTGLLLQKGAHDLDVIHWLAGGYTCRVSAFGDLRVGEEGRLENFGDTVGGVIRLWNRRHDYRAEGDAEFPIADGAGGHGSCDVGVVDEFLRYLREGGERAATPLAAREAVAAGVTATKSLRSGGAVLDVPPAPHPHPSTRSH